MQKNITLAFALPIAVVIGLSGCGQSESQAADSPQTAVSDSASNSAEATQVDSEVLSLDDAWVKAADDGMTAVFGELHNNSDHDINLVEAKYADAKMVELHETTEDGSGGMSMQQKKGGFVIPAGKSISFEPGGDHIMIMGLKKAIKPGEQITLELVTSDDETVKVTAVAKEYSGAQENYAPGEAESDHDGSDHGDHGDH
jgi:copper(I)-binding protein